MGRPRSTRPTDAEFEILHHLWERDTATVRDIEDDLKPRRKVAYTSIATIMRIMVEKKLVEIVDERRPQRFRAVIGETEARKQVTDEWLSRQFDGSITQLVRHALANRRLTRTDVQELKQIIESAGTTSGKVRDPSMRH